MESSAPGTIERAGITAELALAVNPKLVIVRVSTYGQYGKEDYLGRPGYDGLAQAYGGMMSITGDPSGPPQRAKTYTGDIPTSLTGWAATLMALMVVQETGQGQVIDCAQFEAVAQTQGNVLPSIPVRAQLMDTLATGPRDFNRTTPSSARMVTSLSAPSVGRSTPGYPSFWASILKFTITTNARKMLPH